MSIVEGANLFNKNFPFYLHNYVALDEETSLWNWYGTHVFYEDGNINSQYFEFVNEIFIPKFIEMGIFKSLIRINFNFIPIQLHEGAISSGLSLFS